MNPLANKIRPKNLDEVIGQKHLLGEGKILQDMISSGHLMNMIFYGPPGTGKTTVANIIASATGKKFYKLNATTDSLKDIKDIIKDLNTIMGYNGVILYIDEIHHFTKRIQQSLLEFIENGQITLIGSTTENPYFYIFKAILSRSIVLEFKKLTKEDIVEGIKRALELVKDDFPGKSISYDESALDYMGELCEGDMRRALNILELIVYSSSIKEDKICISLDSIERFSQKKILNYDRDGDSHYDILSAFQKSIRGSDANAAILYLGMLIKAGDLTSICRRLLVIASEDIGLAYPQAISIVKSCTDAALQLGFPEGRIPLAEAVILLATAPKSNSAILAIDAALKDLDTLDVGEIPLYLKDGHYEGAKALGRMQDYKYPHNYKNSYVKQQYLPDKVKTKQYYNFGNNKMEQISKAYWDKIK
ncbi:replication-associated recombination protein A [Clostridium sp. P21]|uniref:Replication-associated recombination protein A n=1 Tax=Clostridium muellerianum TaxID=2716538 RepID=A0A7Y0ELB3_9CLOT|nr:replication-associated recombination protein A [Clostridium muellerianum]NMM65584.1 replication-associated recombination protein A [Clostridium muellerianum]